MENKLFFCINKAFILSRLLCFCCLFVGLYSCQEEDNTILNTGKLSFQMGVDTTLVGSSSTRASNILELSGFDDPDSYKVVISQDSGVVAEYARFDKMPAEIELEAGAYSVEVSKGTKTAAAFNSPYFSGKQDFTIVKDMTTPVEVTASMENSRVTVDFSDDFLETYKDYTLSFKTNKMTLPLVYEKGEYRPMYFQADASGTKLTIGMELVNVYGKDVQYTATTTIKQKQWTKLTVRTDEKGLNGVAIDVVLNDETKETVYVNIGIPDFMEQLKGAPHVTCETFQWTGNEVQETPFDLGLKDVGNVLDAPTLVSVLAGGKIAEMKLSLSQDNKTVFNYDLANLSEDQQATLKNEYKLDVNSADIKDKLQYSFDMQPLLNALKGTTAESEYLVTLSVKDALPNPNTTVRSLKGILNKVGAPSITTELSVMSFEEESYVGGEVNVEFSAPAGIKLVQLNISELISEDITAGSSISNIEYVSGSNQILFKPEWFNSLKYGTYVVTINIEDLYGQTASKSFNIEVKAPAFEWAMAGNEGDVFATYAFLRVKAKDASKVKFYQNGEEITSNLESLGRNEETGVVSFVWKGLDSGTKYENITAKYAGERELGKMSFTTEKVESIPNGDMEEWTVGPDGMEGHGEVQNFLVGVKYKRRPYRSWERWYPFNNSEGKHWDTLNLLTTSLGEERDGFLGAGDNKRWTRYVSNSGTIRTSGYNGGYAALVRTVGWGDGNTAGSDDGLMEGNSGTKTPGELYLGFYENDSKYGIDFTSRPRGFKFKYKYKAQNADKFKAEIVLLNGTEVIAKAALDDSYKIPDQDWQEVKVLISDYSDKNVTSMYISFVSGTSTSSEDLMIKPGFGNLTTGEYVGSQLYIDDVELIYDYE